MKKDHEKRLDALKRDQEMDKRKAELIEMNLPLVRFQFLVENDLTKIVCQSLGRLCICIVRVHGSYMD